MDGFVLLSGLKLWVDVASGSLISKVVGIGVSRMKVFAVKFHNVFF